MHGVAHGRDDAARDRGRRPRGGRETMIAWIVAASGTRLRVTDELYWTSDRAHSGLAIESHLGKLRVGIPELPDGAVHDRDDWALRIGTRTIAFEKLACV